MIPQGRWFIYIVINGDYIVINDDLFFWGAQQKKYPMMPQLGRIDFRWLIVLLLREKHAGLLDGLLGGAGSIMKK